MFESKRTFSDVNFYQKSYTDIQGEYAKQIAEIEGIIDGSDVRLREQQEIIKRQIQELASFCKECNPKK